jgi:DNA recombination protein RmuC
LNSEREEKIELKEELENQYRNKELVEKNLKESIDSKIFQSMQLNNENFLNLARQTLEKYYTEADKGLQNKTLEIEKIIQPLQKSLEQYDKKISEFQIDTSKNIGGIGTYLKELSNMQNELTKQTSMLVGALKSPKVRGKWGEIGLKRIVEFSGLNEYCDFSEQVLSETDLTRPDMIIQLPENKKIIVDSKLPLDSYLSAIETTKENEQYNLIQNHLKAIKDSIKRLSSKNYKEKFTGSIDFVVMYIEIEPALSSALTIDVNLLNEALKNGVLLATPTTFIALLQTVAYGWKQYKLSENANNVLFEAQELYKRMIVFTEHFSKIGNSINNVNSSFNQAIASWNSRVEPSLRKIESYGIKENQREVAKLKEIEQKNNYSED